MYVVVAFPERAT